MSSLSTRREPPTIVSSNPASSRAENESNDKVVTALKIHDRSNEETNSEAHPGAANVEAVAAAEAELARLLLQRHEDIHPACNDSLLQQMRLVSQIFETLVAGMHEREAQMEVLELRVDELGKIFKELTAKLRSE